MSEEPLERAETAIQDAKDAAREVPNVPLDDDEAPRQEPVSSPGTSPEPDRDEGPREGVQGPASDVE